MAVEQVWAADDREDGEPAPSPADTLLDLRHVSLVYPFPGAPVQVLDDVHLHAEAGEIIAITGPSGSGKSSLIAVIAGLEQATSGTVVVAGADLAGSSEAERTRLRRERLGIVFQAFHLVPAMDAVENAALPLTLAGERDARRRATEMLEAVGLGHRLDHRPSTLSGGEQQRVAIARAFVARPRLILADEPTGNLDQRTGKKIIDIMFVMAREMGAALLLVTHDPALTERCDRAIALADGRLVG